MRRISLFDSFFLIVGLKDFKYVFARRREENIFENTIDLIYNMNYFIGQYGRRKGFQNPIGYGHCSHNSIKRLTIYFKVNIIFNCSKKQEVVEISKLYTNYILFDVFYVPLLSRSKQSKNIF